jgi:hypothetical protein
MKTVLAIMLMICIGAALAIWVGTHTAEITKSHFDEVNRVFEEARMSYSAPPGIRIVGVYAL